MEKILNEDERMRRAEEIYLRRNNRNINLFREKETKTKKYIGSKFLLYLIILLDIAILVFCLQNKEYIFTEAFLNECNEYNMNISKKVNEVINNFLVEDTLNENVVDNNIEQIIDGNMVTENQESKDENKMENIVAEQQITSVESSLSEMDLDVQNLKSIYKFVKPLEASISSVFGARESEYQNVTGFHKGIDLAAEKGIPIKAAMEGIVTLVSNEGDYRKTFKNKM